MFVRIGRLSAYFLTPFFLSTEPNMFAHAMIHSHDIQEPSAKVHNVLQKGMLLTTERSVSQSMLKLIVFSVQTSHSTMLIVVICASFVLLISGVGIARLRNNTNRNTDKHLPCPKVSRKISIDALNATLTHQKKNCLGCTGTTAGLGRFSLNNHN